MWPRVGDWPTGSWDSTFLRTSYQSPEGPGSWCPGVCGKSGGPGDRSLCW